MASMVTEDEVKMQIDSFFSGEDVIMERRESFFLPSSTTAHTVSREILETLSCYTNVIGAEENGGFQRGYKPLKRFCFTVAKVNAFDGAFQHGMDTSVL